jgi:hypothetical protein
MAAAKTSASAHVSAATALREDRFRRKGENGEG